MNQRRLARQGKPRGKNECTGRMHDDFEVSEDWGVLTDAVPPTRRFSEERVRLLPPASQGSLHPGLRDGIGTEVCYRASAGAIKACPHEGQR